MVAARARARHAFAAAGVWNNPRMPPSPASLPALIGNLRTLIQQRRFAEAFAQVDRALAAWPHERGKLLLLRIDVGSAAGDAAALDADAHRLVDCAAREAAPAGVAYLAALRARHRFDDALQLLARLGAQTPGIAIEAYNLGVDFTNAGELPKARDSYAAALAAQPAFAEAQLNLGDAWLRDREFLRAQAHFRHAVRLQPSNANAWLGLGQCELNLGNGEAALHALGRVGGPLAHAPLMLAWRATALAHCGREDEALALYEQALAADPRSFDAAFGQAFLLERRRDFAAAAIGYARAHALQPQSNRALGNLVFCLRSIAAWHDMTAPESELLRRLEAGQFGDYATSWLSLPLPAQTLRRIAAHYSHTQCTLRVAPVAQREFAARGTGRLRVGYVSADFREHATSHLLVEVLERHDRARLEVFAYSLAPDDGSALRRRVMAACEHFVDVAGMAVPDIAARVLADRIDVLVDLHGHTGNACQGLAALRPAPVIVNYLGFPGSMGAFADYIIGDPFVTPAGAAAEFSEAIARLPHCYQPNDRRREIGAATTRAEHGLPDDAIVACSFNQSWKLTPEIWAIWMRLLTRHARLVLWLIEDNRWVRDNLTRHAAAAGIDARRLVFAPPLPSPRHLARLALADLMLDTARYNSHTNASDALRMGVPLVTLCGGSFAARVGASLLHAVGLPELIAHDEPAYERILDALISAPDALAALKRRLLEQGHDVPLFDSAATARALERAYATMAERCAAGLTPAEFDVPDAR